MWISEVFGLSKPPLVAPGAVFKKGMYGIEIEVEGAEDTETNGQQWAMKDDPSLRNGGMELVLRNPMGGTALEAALQELESLYMDNPQWQVNDRCSMHCHLDFRGDTVQDVVSFVVTWLLFEAGMYTVSGKDRYTNIYCPGANNCFSLITKLNELFRTNDHRAVRRLIHEWPRYTGVNLNSLETFGSVEIRTHRGTAAVSDIWDWLLLLRSIKEYSTGKHPQEILKEADQWGVVSLASRVFGSDAHKVLCVEARQYFAINYMNACDVVGWSNVPNTTPAPATASNVEEMVAQILEALDS